MPRGKKNARDGGNERGAGDNLIGPAGAEQLRSLEHRIMGLLADRDEINEDIAEVFKEVKEAGFETKTVRKVIAKKRAMDKDIAGFRAQEELADLYFATLYQAELPGFEALNPGLSENRKKTTKKAAAAPAAPAKTEGDGFEAPQEEIDQQRSRTALRVVGDEAI